MAVEAKEILAKVFPYMNSAINGFDKSLAACQESTATEAEKLFINNCQNLIEKDWSDDICKIENNINILLEADVDNADTRIWINDGEVSFSKVNFFSGVLHDLLKRYDIFMGKKLSETQKDILSCFTKMILFRLLFNAHQDKRCSIIGCPWFNRVKNELDDKYKNLYEKTPYIKALIYEGEFVTTNEGVKKITTKYKQLEEGLESETAAASVSGTIKLVLGLFFWAGSTYMLAESADTLNISNRSLIAVSIFLGFCLFACSAGCDAKMRYGRGERRNLFWTEHSVDVRPDNLTENVNIKKHICVSIDEIDELKKLSETQNITLINRKSGK